MVIRVFHVSVVLIRSLLDSTKSYIVALKVFSDTSLH